jgi:hypothetical protein
MNTEIVPYNPQQQYNPYGSTANMQYPLRVPMIDNKTGKIIAYVLAGSIVAYIGYRIYLNVRAKQAQKNSYDPAKPESFAQEFRMALENNNWMGWGTDNTVIRQTLLKIPSKDFMLEVVNAYARLYKGASMMAEIKSDLKTGEYQELLAIIGGKPQSGDTVAPLQLTQQQYESWAKRIQAALNDTFLIKFPATDLEALIQVINEVPSKAAWMQLKNVYRTLVASDLENDLKKKLPFFDYNTVISLVNKKQ